MAQRTLPGLGLTGYWPLGYDGWKDEMDINLRLLSMICQASFKDFAATEPGGPSDGDIYVFTVSPHANDFLIRDNGAWVYITPRKGTFAYNEAAAGYFIFDGDSWNALTVDSASETYQDPVRIFTFSGDGDVDWETGGAITVQSVALADGDRVGLGDQSNAAENLIYIVRSAGTWDRADGWDDGDPISSGTLVPVEEGTYTGSLFQLVTHNPIDIGTDDMVWKNNAKSGRINYSGANKTGDFTIRVADARRWFYLTKAGNQDVLLPTHAAEAIPGGTEFVVQYYGGSGTKTIAADTGVFLNGVSGGSVTLTTNGTAYWIKKRTKTTWVAIPLGSSSSSYSDENAVDAVAAAFAAGTHTGITITYNDVSDSFDFTATGSYTAENARDDIGAALVGGTGITVTPNDGADTITIATTITQYTDELAQDALAAAFAAGTHTGITITYNDVSNSFDFTATGSYTAENARDDVGAALVGGTGMTVTVNDGADTITLATTITQYTDEMAQDALAAAFAAGTHTNLTITYNDASNKFDFAVSGISAYTDENAQDAIATLIQNGTGITWSYNDASNTLTPTVTITQYTDEAAMDAIAAMIAAGTHTNLTFTYNDASNLMSVALNTALTGGFKSSSYSLGTVTSGTVTPDPVNGNMQHVTANGAFTLAVPTASGEYTIAIEVTNGASAGTISTSGFTKTNGDTYATTNANKYLYQITKHKNYSLLTIVSLN